MKEKVLSVMRGVLDNQNIDDSCTQETCEEWDSLHHLNIIAELEETFNIEFEPDEIARMKSASVILEVVESKL